MKTLELNQMELIDGGSCAGSIGFAIVAVGMLALFIAAPPLGAAALYLGGIGTGLGVGAGIGSVGVDCFLEQ
jgi:hypothetical protein